MSYWVHHRGEHANRAFAEVFWTEYDLMIVFPERRPNYYGPHKTREAAVKEAERRGLTLTSLQDLPQK